MSTQEKPTLTFQNRFSNGVVVTLHVLRRENDVPKMIPDKKDFFDGIEKEYEQWVHGVADFMVSERLLTEGEIIALALKNLERFFGKDPA